MYSIDQWGSKGLAECRHVAMLFRGIIYLFVFIAQYIISSTGLNIVYIVYWGNWILEGNSYYLHFPVININFLEDVSLWWRYLSRNVILRSRIRVRYLVTSWNVFGEELRERTTESYYGKIELNDGKINRLWWITWNLFGGHFASSHFSI